MEEAAETRDPPQRAGRNKPNLGDALQDGQLLRDILKMVAPALGFSPRRLKHFLSLFRLRHYVLQSIGVLGEGSSSSLTLPQLGKISAIEIRWPRLIDALEQRATALQELDKVADGSGPADLEDSFGELFARWTTEKALLDLLRSKCGNDDCRVRDVDPWLVFGTTGPASQSLPSPPGTWRGLPPAAETHATS
jgi:hypothetical protein